MSSKITPLENESTTFRTIQFLRFPLAVMVVFIHSFGKEDFYGWTEQTLTFYNIVRVTLSHTICLIAVPSFFMISGYLFYKRLEEWDWHIWKTKLKSRFHTLFVPYFAWVTLRLLFNRIDEALLNGCQTWEQWKAVILSKVYIIGTYWHYAYADMNSLNWFGYPAPLSTPLHTPFWYIRDLIVFVLISPLLFRLLTKWGGRFCLLVGVIYISSLWPMLPIPHIKGFFFFCLGAWICIRRKHISISSLQYIVASFLFMLLAVLMVYNDGKDRVHSIITPIFIIVGVFIIFRLGERCVNKYNTTIIDRLSESSFFVFAFHVFVLIMLRRVEDYCFLFCRESELVCLYFFNPIAAITICILLYYLLKSLMPKFRSVLCGR